VFESHTRLEEQVAGLLQGIRAEAGGRYAAIVEPARVVFESFDEGDEQALRLRHFVERRSADLFALPAAMAGEQALDDLFEEWREDAFVVAVVNGRVALLLACPDAEAARAGLDRPLRTLADRLFRFEPRWRLDARGRGYFLGRARLEVVVVGRAAD
jgi:hypothetical protein